MKQFSGSEFSSNRFKAKGFKGHRRNPAHGELDQQRRAGQPRMSNYVRHQISKANRAVRKGKING